MGDVKKVERIIKSTFYNKYLTTVSWRKALANSVSVRTPKETMRTFFKNICAVILIFTLMWPKHTSDIQSMMRLLLSYLSKIPRQSSLPVCPQPLLWTHHTSVLHIVLPARHPPLGFTSFHRNLQFFKIPWIPPPSLPIRWLLPVESTQLNATVRSCQE
jgi:hypothetical protein